VAQQTSGEPGKRARIQLEFPMPAFAEAPDAALGHNVAVDDRFHRVADAEIVFWR